MFNEREKERQRLEEALLAEEQPPAMPDEDDDFLLAYDPEPDLDTVPRDHPSGYRNFANGYQAYTNQPGDVDLEALSRQVREEKRSNGPLIALAFGLTACILLVLAWWLWRYVGVFA